VGRGLEISPDLKVQNVSNLLGSPASGEQMRNSAGGKAWIGFQFIGFPSEWGARPDGSVVIGPNGFQFIVKQGKVVPL
jgi:hypothetical protein